MLLLRNTKEYYEAEVADEIREVIDTVIEESDEPFENSLGGDIFIVESAEDLERIPAWNIDGNEGDNIVNTVGSWEIAEKLSERWAFLWLGTNNSGGPAYFIPARLWGLCQIEKQIGEE
jgi:hypothetical protein